MSPLEMPRRTRLERQGKGNGWPTKELRSNCVEKCPTVHQELRSPGRDRGRSRARGIAGDHSSTVAIDIISTDYTHTMTNQPPPPQAQARSPLRPPPPTPAVPPVLPPAPLELPRRPRERSPQLLRPAQAAADNRAPPLPRARWSICRESAGRRAHCRAPRPSRPPRSLSRRSPCRRWTADSGRTTGRCQAHSRRCWPGTARAGQCSEGSSRGLPSPCQESSAAGPEEKKGTVLEQESLPFLDVLLSHLHRLRVAVQARLLLCCRRCQLRLRLRRRRREKAPRRQEILLCIGATCD